MHLIWRDTCAQLQHVVRRRPGVVLVDLQLPVTLVEGKRVAAAITLLITDGRATIEKMRACAGCNQ
jgi:hypothetical protein